MILEQLKFCPGCKELKHVSEFSLERRSKSGLQCRCRMCQKIASAAFFKMRCASGDRPWLAKNLHSRTRSSAKKRGLIYELSPEWFLAKLEAGVCELTGLPFGRSGFGDPNAPSPDRLDNEIGYTDENTRVILWWINQAKGPWPEDVFQSLMRNYAEAMYEHA